MSLLDGLHPLVWINQKIIAQCNRRPLLIWVALVDPLPNMLHRQLIMPILPMFFALFLLGLLVVPHELTVCHLVLAFVGFEAMEDILAKLKINVDWHLVGVVRVQFTELVVDVEVLVWKQPHVYDGVIGFSALHFKQLLLSSP